MNLREVREAAARLHNGWHSQSPKLLGDYETVCDFVLATIDPEPDSAITADWLREVWGGRKPTPLEQYDHSSSSTEEQVSFDSHNGVFVNFGVFWEYAVCQHCVTILTTRQQFCDLARCLGISRKDGVK
jgi:hypothetical protein